MDPPHITEFASQRYFEKLRQLSEPKDQPHDAVTHPHDGHTAAQSSTFILPIGQSSRLSDQQITHDHHKSEKRRANFSFRTILPTRASAEHDIRRSSTESTRKKSIPFDQLFANLPNELKIQIIASLPLSDVLSMRLASRSWLAMITFNESSITRYHLEHHVPAYATRLYPAPEPSAMKLHYLCGIWHRLHVASKLSILISERVTKEIFLRTTEAQRNEFAPQYERMRRRLVPLLFTIFHFFETYRSMHLEYIKEHGHGLRVEPYTVNPIESKVLNMYDDQTLLRVHQVFPLVVSSFCRRLRPPSYVGRFERSLRGYLRDKPEDEVYVTALCVGGLRQVERFWEVKGYNTRRAVVDTWYQSVTNAPVEHPPKPRRGFMGLSRKKSNFNIGEGGRATTDSTTSNRERRGSDNGRRGSDISTTSWRDFVFGTSLSEGMPMGPLPREHLQMLLPNLPDLHSIWLPTAEALILDRGIVGRPQDIKRNGPALLDLIREDGAAEEDEWLYGRTAPESVRPPLEAIEEDPIE
ncbi:putative F-box domain-containing protein [Rosellinia necatrix]|uniref:Putative F-box domain-containing protein n=1 Tax=Rosellinia necatrix TaxID=77044 RepID=A0A1S7UHC9_ROSNE|nr:putative F-box domain-containing protein [Rosellinia necatrix]